MAALARQNKRAFRQALAKVVAECRGLIRMR